MSVSLVKGCRRCCGGPLSPALPVGYPPNAWEPSDRFAWSADDVAAEVAARFGPEWRMDAARNLGPDRGDTPSWRVYFTWDDLILIVHARAAFGDAWERRELCDDDGCDDTPHVHDVVHYRGDSWNLTADLVAWDEKCTVADGTAVDAIMERLAASLV